MDNSARIAAIQAALAAQFPGGIIDIEDDSHLHAGHSSHGGAGHFRIRIIADAFSGKSRVQRHQMVFAAVNQLMGKDIHALGIYAFTPAEYAEKQNNKE